MDGIRRLKLPGGGTFDIPLNGADYTDSNLAGLADDMLLSPMEWPRALPILAGAALGGLLTWALLKFAR